MLFFFPCINSFVCYFQEVCCLFYRKRLAWYIIRIYNRICVFRCIPVVTEYDLYPNYRLIGLLNAPENFSLEFADSDFLLLCFATSVQWNNFTGSKNLNITLATVRHLSFHRDTYRLQSQPFKSMWGKRKDFFNDVSERDTLQVLMNLVSRWCQ